MKYLISLVWLFFFNPCISVVFTLCFAMLWGGTHNSGNPDTDMAAFNGYEWVVVTPIFSYLVGCVMFFLGNKLSRLLKLKLWFVRIGIFAMAFAFYFLTACLVT